MAINTPRWLAGGVVAGIVLWLLESAASLLYINDMQTALRAHGLNIEYAPSLWVMSIGLSLLVGLALVFFYAASRPRFGPGPRLAVIVACALWLGMYVPSLIGYDMIGLYSRRLLGLWGVVGLAEMIVANLIGAWIYRESLPAVP
jgi:hypothetical protein